MDFEQGLNFCIRQIREALGDTADSPQFIETLPRRGYRFLMPVKSSAVGDASELTRLIVLPFRMLRPDPDRLPRLQPAGRAHASLSGLESLVVRSSLAASRFAGGTGRRQGHRGAKRTWTSIVTGTLLRAGDEIA